MKRFIFFLKQFFYFLDPQTVTYLINRIIVILWLIFFVTITVFSFSKSFFFIAFVSLFFSFVQLKSLLFEVRTKDIKRGKINDIRICGNSHDIALKPIQDKKYVIVLVANTYEYTDIYKLSEARHNDGTYTWENEKVGKSIDKKKTRKVISFEQYPLTRLKALILLFYFLGESNNSVFNSKYIHFHLKRIYMPFYRRLFVLPFYHVHVPTLHQTPE